MKAQLQILAVAVVVSFLTGCSESADRGKDVLGPSVGAAGGGPPQSGGGTGAITVLQITSSRAAGGNVIQTRHLEGFVNGTLNGTFVEDVRGVIHANGLVTFQGTLEFTGTVDGCGDVGTVTARLAGRGIAGAPVTDATFAVTKQGPGGHRLTGHGSMHQNGPALTYQVQYNCR